MFKFFRRNIYTETKRGIIIKKVFAVFYKPICSTYKLVCVGFEIEYYM